MAYHKTRYFKLKTLGLGEFANGICSIISHYNKNPDRAHLDFVQWFPDNSSVSKDYAKYEHLHTICDLSSHFSLRIWSSACYEKDSTKSQMDNIYLGFNGGGEVFEVSIQAAAQEYVEAIFKKVISQLNLEETISPYEAALAKASSKLKILFLAADPTNTSRLRLGQELREIQEKLQLAKLREQFDLNQRMSVRPVDISQSLLDDQPRIVHFSGHGTPTGALCFENSTGETHPVYPDALSALFEQFTDSIECVILNACYSEKQAKAIAEHIPFVIGISNDVGDDSAIAFSIGFYQALGAGRTIEEAYKLGCVQIKLQGMQKDTVPILIRKT